MNKLVERMGLHQAETFKIDIRKIEIGNIWIGERKELDEDFFEDYDSINYIKGRKTLMIKLEYPDHFQCLHDLKEDIDAPLEEDCFSANSFTEYLLFEDNISSIANALYILLIIIYFLFKILLFYLVIQIHKVSYK